MVSWSWSVNVNIIILYQYSILGFVSPVNTPLVKRALEDKWLFDMKPYQQEVFSNSQQTSKIFYLIFVISSLLADCINIFYGDSWPISSEVLGFYSNRTTIHWCSPDSPLKSNFWKWEQTRAGSFHVLYSRKNGETLIISFHYYVMFVCIPL